MFIHKMTIDGLDISEFVIEQDIYDHISASKAKYQDIYTRKQIIDSQITSNQSESQNLKSQITNNIQKKNILTSKFSSIDPKQLETLKSQKNTYIQDRQSSQDIFLSNPKISSLSISTRTDLNIYINNQIQNGKDLKLDLSAIENSKQLLSSNYQNLLLQKQNLEQSEKQSQEHATQLAKSQISSQITNHQNQLTHIAKNLDDKLKQKKILTEKLIALQTDLSAQSKFHCAKIAADCPFI